jgi:hypothetical protein
LIFKFIFLKQNHSFIITLTSKRLFNLFQLNNLPPDKAGQAEDSDYS